MEAQYKLKIDTSQLTSVAKEIQKIKGELQQTANNEVVIKFEYDANQKELSKIVKNLQKVHPELAVQFEYDVNKKALEAEQKKLADMSAGNNLDSIIKQLTEVNEKYNEIINSDATDAEISKVETHLANLFATFDEMVDGAIDEYNKLPEAVRATWEDIEEMSEGEPLKLFSEEDVKKQVSIIETIENKLEDLRKQGAVDTVSTFVVDPAETQQIQKTTEAVEELADATQKLDKATSAKSKDSNIHLSDLDILDLDDAVDEEMKQLKQADDLAKEVANEIVTAFANGFKNPEIINEISNELSNTILNALREDNEAYFQVGQQHGSEYITGFEEYLENGLERIQEVSSRIVSALEHISIPEEVFTRRSDSSVETQLEATEESFRDVASVVKNEVTNAIEANIDSQERYAIAVAETTNELQRQAEQAFKIDTSQNKDFFSTDIERVTGEVVDDTTALSASVEVLRQKYEQLVNSLVSVTTWYEKISDFDASHSSASIGKEALALEDLQASAQDASEGKKKVKDANVQLKKSADDTSKSVDKESKNLEKMADMLSRERFAEKINKFIANNKHLSKTTIADLNDLTFSALDESVELSTKQLSKMYIELDRIQTKAKVLGQTGTNWFDKLGKKWGEVTRYLATQVSLYKVIDVMRQGVTEVKNIDTALTELRKVSDATEQRLTQSFTNSAKTAKELGSTITDVINITSDWARLGYDVDAAEDLAKVTTLFKTVGDNMSAEDASSYLVSTLQGFQMSADQAEDIVDKYNEVANNFAIDTRGIGEALQRSAASFKAANTDLSESIALVTTANAVVQNPEAVGTMFKTLSARIRGASTELAELDEEEDEFTKTTSKLRDLVKGLTGFDIMEDEDTFKDIYEILVGIGKEWDNLTDIERASLGEALAGKRNANALYAVLNNIETLESAYATAEDAAGSAQKEQENYAKSIQYSIDVFKASVQELWNTLLDNGTLKAIVDFGTKVIQQITEIADKLGPGGVLGVFGALTTMLLKMKLSDKNNGLGSTLSSLVHTIKEFKGEDVTKTLVSIANKLTATAETAETLKDAGDAAEDGLKTAAKGASTATTAFQALGTILMEVWPLLVAVAGAVVAYKAWDHFTTTVEEAREELDKTSSKIEDVKSQIKELEDLDYRDEAQENRLKNLKDELELQEQIYAVEKRRVMQEQYGHKFSDYTDKDNYNAKLVADTNGQNKGSSSQLLIFDKNHQQEIKEATQAVEKYEKALRALMSGDANEYKLAGFTKDRITKLLNDAKADLEGLQNERDETQADIAAKIVDYRADIQAMESDLEFMENDTEGLFTDADIAELKKEIALYQNQLDILEKSREGYLRATGKFQYSQEEQFARLIGEHLNVKFDEKGFSNLSNQIAQIQDYIDSLSPDQKTALFELGLDPSSFDGMDAQEAIDYINGLLEEAGPAEVGIDVNNMSISETVDSINQKLKPAMDALGEVYTQVLSAPNQLIEGSLGKIDLIEQVEKIKSQLDSLNDIDGIEVDYSSFEHLVEVLQDTESSGKEVQDAFDAVATSIADAGIQGSESLETLIAALSDMGVVNAASVAISRLAEDTTALADAGLNLETATDAEIEAWAREIAGAEEASQAIAILKMQKILLNENALDETSSIQQLMDLAGVAGVATHALAELMAIQSKIGGLSVELDNAIASGNAAAAAHVTYEIEMLKAKAETVKTQVATDISTAISSSYTSPSNTSAAKGGGKDTGKSFVDGFNEELSKLKDSYDRGEITLAQYLAAYRALIDKYFADTEANAEDRAKALHDYLATMKGYYDSAISGVTTLIDYRIKGVQKQKDAAIKALEAERDAALKVYDDQIKAIDKVIKEKNKQIKALEKEKKALEKQKKELDKQKELIRKNSIEPLEKEKQAIADANAERERQLELQKNLYELERAQNQRTQFIYKDGQMVYQSDPEAIRNARENVKKSEDEQKTAELDKQIKMYEEQITLIEQQQEFLDQQIESIDEAIEGIQEEIEALNEQKELLEEQRAEVEEFYNKLIEDTTKYFDDLIERLEETKSKWERLAEIDKIASAWNDVGQVMEMLGYSVDDVLNDVPGAFDAFEQAYIACLANMNGQNDQYIQGLAEATGKSEEEIRALMDQMEGLGDKTKGALDGTDEAISGIGDAASTASGNVNNYATAAGTAATNTQALKQATEGVGEDIQAISDATNSLDGSNLEGLIAKFEELRMKIAEIKIALGAVETGSNGEQSLGGMGSIVGAIESLNGMTLESLIEQFNLLGESIQAVVGALGGSGGEEGPAGGGASGGSAEAGGGEGGEGGDTLVSAIEAVKESADTNIGTGEDDEEGTVIGDFNKLKTSITDATTAIGTLDSEADAGDLIGSVVSLGEKNTEVLTGGEGGEGAISEWEQFNEQLAEAQEHISEMVDGLEGLADSYETSLKVKLEIEGGAEFTGTARRGKARGTYTLNVLDVIGLPGEGGEWESKLGKGHAKGTAFLSGTANLSGNWAYEGGSTLIGEIGPELVVFPDGHFETFDYPQMVNLPKGSVIFNHLQTEEILDGKNQVRHLAGGNAIPSNFSPLSQANPDAFNSLVQNAELLKANTADMKTDLADIGYDTDAIKKAVQNITNNSKVGTTITFGNLQFTCNGITSAEVMNEVGNALEREFQGIALNAYQRAVNTA